jgi:hypothetical protein
VYIAIDANIELCEEDGLFDVYGYLKKVRGLRRGLVETLVSSPHRCTVNDHHRRKEACTVKNRIPAGLGKITYLKQNWGGNKLFEIK